VVMKRKNIRSDILKAIGLLIFAFCCIAPFLWIISLSLKNNLDAFTIPFKFIFVPTFEHYQKLFMQADFARYFANSLLTSVIGVGLSAVIGVPAAYAFSKTRFKGSRFLYFLLLLSRVTPGTVFAIPYYMVYQKLNLIDNIWGLGLIFFAVTFGLITWSMKPFFDELPPSLEESAMIEGCTMLKAMWKIILPLATPGLCATLILSFIFCWNEFFFALILTHRNALTAPIGILNFMVFEKVDWGPIAAGSVVTSIPVLIFGIAIRKYFIRGLAAGALSSE
jgi:multiple sugar transport system permease protein